MREETLRIDTERETFWNRSSLTVPMEQPYSGYRCSILTDQRDSDEASRVYSQTCAAQKTREQSEDCHFKHQLPDIQ